MFPITTDRLGPGMWCGRPALMADSTGHRAGQEQESEPKTAPEAKTVRVEAKKGESFALILTMGIAGQNIDYQ